MSPREEIPKQTPAPGQDFGQPMAAHVNPILPDDTVTGRSLLAVVAIMSFLAALAVGAVEIVQTSAAEWRTDVVREITVQLRPLPGRDMEADLRKAVEIASAAGVADVRVFTREETERLLAPWLGTGVDFSALPVPRLIQAKIGTATPDLSELRRTLGDALPNATLDDHRGFASRLGSISDAVVLTGIVVLALVLAATVLSVSFATRGAVAANRAVVEVLHFVGARDSYVAKIFSRHFLTVGLKGGLIGGALAAALFGLLRLTADTRAPLPSGANTTFFGHFSLNARGFLWIAAVAAGIALVTAISSRLTVHRTLRAID